MTFPRLSLSVLAVVACQYLLSLAIVSEDVSFGLLRPQRLRCEYRSNPLGVDQQRPELSWIVTSDSRGQMQTAYRILVASTPEILESNEGDLWDTKKVSGDATFGVMYAGTELQSHQPCFWKIMVWDSQDRASTWSESAYWSVGVLKPDEWVGDWIGCDAMRHLNSDPPAAPLHGAQ
jgi:alpha-L-rhamnosidase